MARGLKVNDDGTLHVPEEDVQRTCVEFMERNGWLPVNFNQNGLLTTPTGKKIYIGAKGRPDYLFMRPMQSHRGTDWCRVVWIEFKTKARDSRMKPAQRRWREYLLDMGFTHLVVRSFEELRDWHG